MVDAPVRVGEVLAGKYRVDRVLSAGGMGVVVAATHLELHEPVCLKFMLGDLASSPDAVDRFLREARAAVKLKGEHVCRVMDVGRLDGGAPFIVMELLEGTDLAGLVRQRGRLSSAETAALVVQACAGLGEAHALGIVHRDIKPANIFVTTRRDGSVVVKVLDFGISKASFASDGFVATQTQSLMGTPAYMSPEQMRSAKHVDGRTDIWALGAVLYELLVGRPPFLAQTLTELITKVLTEPLAPITDVPLGMFAIVARCLEKDRELRYATVGELATALSRLGDPQAPAQPRPEARQPRVTAPDPTRPPRSAFPETLPVASLAPVASVAPVPSLAPTRGSRRYLWVAGILAGAGAAVVLLVLMLTRSGTTNKTKRLLSVDGLPPLYQQAQERCGAGNGAACTQLARAYLSGKDLVLDSDRGIGILDLGCKHQDAAGCRVLAELLYKGVGVKQDLTRAATLFDAACAAKDSEACTYLASMYLDGEGVLRDAPHAKQLLEQSCDAGNYDGCGFLAAVLTSGGDGVTRDAPRALELFKRACAGQVAIACRQLGDFEMAGTAVPKDEAAAKEAYANACRLGDKKACGR